MLYLKQRAREQKLKLNEDEIKQYFPLDNVIKQILNVYCEILGVKFNQLVDVPLWQDTVIAYLLDKDSDAELGYFYLDLFSRDGKYGHQCVFPIMPSHCDSDGNSVVPMCAILGNFTKPTPERPSLLLFDEVRTFFHEFGHVMHCVLSRASYSLFAWAWAIVPWIGGVENDFLEVPSMMFELWMYEEEVLKRISGHYTNLENKLPIEIIKNLSKSEYFLESISKKIYIAMALYDMVIHDQEPPYTWPNPALPNLCLFTKDPKTDLGYIELFQEILSSMALQNYPNNVFKGASWYHLCMGYDAGYYGYLWSEVYAHELFHVFQQSPKKCFDSETGMKIRKLILEPSARKDGMEMLKSFLGREPDVNGYLARIKQITEEFE
jgi:Zn-dependent oligopeptidase